ncbi:MAG TPA: hypothetical protein VNJ02_11385 [Vicinamibacterales bacterium]|nr:hypothetical protein [Vicinamibacterales bacterium]
MTKRRNWVLILFGVAVLLVFIGIGAVIGVTAWLRHNMEFETTTDRNAQTEFDTIHNKFGGRASLLELRDGVPRYSAGAAPPAAATRVTIESLNLLVWDPDDERLTRINLPFWLLRMKSGPIEIGAYTTGLEQGGVSLKPEDIERYGAGVILDTSARDGDRVLVWAQ